MSLVNMRPQHKRQTMSIFRNTCANAHYFYLLDVIVFPFKCWTNEYLNWLVPSPVASCNFATYFYDRFSYSILFLHVSIPSQVFRVFEAI